MKLTIVNRSGWPDWFVKPVARWIAARAGIDRAYQLNLVGTRDTRRLAGRAWGHCSRVRVHRRFSPHGGWPYTTKYWKYKWSFTYQLHNRLEAFVDIVAHEMFHATGGHPSKFRKDGRTDVASMEMACERFSKATVEAFRVEWPALRAKCIAELRRDRDRRKAKVIAKSDPTPKLDRAAKNLANWQRKAKLAATKIKKYKQQVRYYEGRVAAKKGK